MNHDNYTIVEKLAIICALVIVGYLFMEMFLDFLDRPVVTFDAVTGECLSVSSSLDMDCNDIGRIVFDYESVRI